MRPRRGGCIAPMVAAIPAGEHGTNANDCAAWRLCIWMSQYCVYVGLSLLHAKTNTGRGNISHSTSHPTVQTPSRSILGPVLHALPVVEVATL